MLLGLVRNQEFQNSSHICQKCECKSTEDTFYLNCTDKQMKHTLANWPDNSKNLIASFSYNAIRRLAKMPGSGANRIKLAYDHCNINELDSGLFESSVNVVYVDLSYNSIPSKLEC